MSMPAYYDLRVFTADGLSVLPSLTDFFALKFSRSRNNPGAFELTLPPDYPESYFGEDTIIEIWRSVDGRTWGLIDQTCWFVREIEYDLDDDGRELLFVRGHDTTGLLNRRIVPWFSLSSAGAGANAPGYKTAPADTLIAELWDENFGSLVEGTLVDSYNTPPPSVTAAAGWDFSAPVLTAKLRQMRRPPFGAMRRTVMADSAPTIEQQTSWANVGDAMRSVSDAAEAKGQKIWFDIVYRAGSASELGDFTFQVWINNRGADLTRAVVLSPHYGTMAATKWRRSWTELANWVHIGGAGQDDLRLVAGILDDESIMRSPFYPIETFIDGGEIYAEDALLDLGRVELRRRRGLRTVSGEVVQSPEVRFGREYTYGDVVSAFYRDTTVLGEIQSYSIEVADGAEKIDIPLEGEEALTP